MKKGWKELKTELQVFSRWLVSGLIDSVFLALWVMMQWVTNKVVSNIQLTGIDQVAFIIFQILFAISTLAPVVIYIFIDISVMLIRARKKIRQEMK